MAQQAADKDRELPYAVRGWFQVPTIVAAALTLIFIVAAVIGFSLGDRSPLFFLGPVGMIFGIICGVVALILVVRDLLAIKYFGRRTPLKGAKAFLGGLSAKRYRFAYYCLLDADKDESLRLRPALPKFGVEAESFSFEQFEGFKTYWKNLLHKGGTRSHPQQPPGRPHGRRSCPGLSESQTDPAIDRRFLALGVIEASLFADRDTLAVKKLFRRVNGQWYAVNGEIDSGEDRFGLASQATSRTISSNCWCKSWFAEARKRPEPRSTWPTFRRRHHAARLPDQEHSGGDIPNLRRKSPQNAKSPRSHIAQIERCRTGAADALATKEGLIEDQQVGGVGLKLRRKTRSGNDFGDLVRRVLV